MLSFFAHFIINSLFFFTNVFDFLFFFARTKIDVHRRRRSIDSISSKLLLVVIQEEE